MKKTYYDLLPASLQKVYTEIEEDLVFSNLPLTYYYEKYQETIGPEDCKKVIAALTGDSAFLSYDREYVETIKDLLYVDCVSNFMGPLVMELEFFALMIDFWLKKVGLPYLDDFMIANCLNYFLQLRNIPCSIALTEFEGTPVFCNLVCDEREQMKVLVWDRGVISEPYHAELSRDFVEFMFRKVSEGREKAGE